VPGRYVRIVGHGQWSGTTQFSLWNSITETAIYGSAAAPVTALPVASAIASGDDGNIPQNTLDNNLATRWSASGDGQWIRYDLGAVMAVGPVTIAWYRGTEWASAFDIEVSLDSLTWTRAFTGRSSGQTLQPERYDFPTVPGRYVRIVGHGQWSGTTQLSLWNSITETAIYVSAAVRIDSVPVASVTVSPTSGSARIGATVQLTGVTKDSAGNLLTRRTVSWMTSNASVATVSAGGLVTGMTAGSATITGTGEGHRVGRRVRGLRGDDHRDERRAKRVGRSHGDARERFDTALHAGQWRQLLRRAGGLGRESLHRRRPLLHAAARLATHEPGRQRPRGRRQLHLELLRQSRDQERDGHRAPHLHFRYQMGREDLWVGLLPHHE